MADLTRRKFLVTAGGVAAAVASGKTAHATLGTETEAPAAAAPMDTDARRWQAYRLRVDAATAARDRPTPAFPTNGDEERYPDRIGR